MIYTKSIKTDFSFRADLAQYVSELQDVCHGIASESGWWTDVKTGESLIGKRNVGELLCLVHSEISEAMEAHRKNLQDDLCPTERALR
jgi:hypothetical protein